MEFSVKVKETLERIVKVEAQDANEAVAIVQDMYRDEEIVLDYSDFADVNIELA